MSTLPPECEQLLIAGYVLDSLSPAEALLMQEMLAENPALQEQVAGMQSALEQAYAPQEMTPPANLGDRILTAANNQGNNQTNQTLAVASTPEVKTSKINLPWNQILGAIAVAIITALGFTNYRLWQATQDPDPQPAKELTYSLNSTKARSALAELTVDSDGLNANLKVEDLPVLPPGKVYALWTVVGKNVPYTTDKKGAILTAVFQVNESGDFTQEIAVPQPHLEPRTIQKVAITVEDIAAPQAHLGEIFLATGN